MKARVKATGEIGIVSQIDVLLKDDFISFNPNNVELMTNYVDKTDDYWEKLKHQYAGMAMQAYMIAAHIGHFSFCENDMKDCVSMATALVEKLKEEHNNN